MKSVPVLVLLTVDVNCRQGSDQFDEEEGSLGIYIASLTSDF